MPDPTHPKLLDISAVATSADHQVRVGVTDGRVDAIHIARGLIDPDHPHTLEAGVLEAVNNALDAQQAAFSEAIRRFADKHAREYPELKRLAKRFASEADE